MPALHPGRDAQGAAYVTYSPCLLGCDPLPGQVTSQEARPGERSVRTAGNETLYTGSLNNGNLFLTVLEVGKPEQT